MSNETDTEEIIFKRIEIVFAITPILIIVFGVVGNTASFLIFRLNDELSKLSSFVYLSFAAITNILSLFVWNLNHFLSLFPGVAPFQFKNMFLCKVFTFNQYWSLECSAALLCMLTIERFLTVISRPGSLVTKLPFYTKKSAYFWSAVILIVYGCINIHILILNGYYDPPVLMNVTENNLTREILYQNPDIHCEKYSPTFSMFPWWDIIHMYFYAIGPFFVMLTFNSLLIYTTLLKKSNIKSNSAEAAKAQKKKRMITVSLLVVTFGFVIMTVPSTLAFGYFYGALASSPFGGFMLKLLDFISFSYHSILFLICYFTNTKFKSVITKTICFKKKKNSQKNSTTISKVN